MMTSTNIEPMKFAQFMFDQLKVSKLCEEIPHGSLRMICDRTAGYYLKGDVFNAETMVEWVVSDYSFARDDVLAMMFDLQPAAARLGVKLRIGGPDESEPNEPPPQSQSHVSIKEAVEVMPRVVPGTFLPVDKEARPSVERILLEEKLWEAMFGDYVFKGQAPQNQAVAKILENLFTFSALEKNYYSTPPQGKNAETMASWIVEVNGKALCYEFANFAVIKDTTEDREGLARALKTFMKNSEAINAKVARMIDRAKKAKIKAAPILDLAWQRLQKAQKKIVRHCEQLD